MNTHLKKIYRTTPLSKKSPQELKNVRELDLFYLLTVADISAVDQGI